MTVHLREHCLNSNQTMNKADSRASVAGGILIVLVAMLVSCPRLSAQRPAPNHRIVIAASTVLDGKGHTLHNVRIVDGSMLSELLTDFECAGKSPGFSQTHIWQNVATHQRSQFSQRRFGTRVNSLSLSVTTVYPRASP